MGKVETDRPGNETFTAQAWPSIIFCIFFAAPGMLFWYGENRFRLAQLHGWVPILVLAMLIFVADGRKIVVSGHDGDCEQKTDCTSCLYNGGICVWVVSPKMTNDYDYCGNFTRLHFQYGESYLLYNFLWCNRIFDESKQLLPGEVEIATVDNNGLPGERMPLRAWIAIVFFGVFAIIGIAGGIWFWHRYNRLRSVQLDTQSRPGSAAGDVHLNSIRRRSTSRQSGSRQGSRRSSVRQLSPIRENHVHCGGGSDKVGVSNQAANPVVHTSFGSHVGTNATGSMASFMQPIQPMPLLNTVGTAQLPSYSSFGKYPFGPIGMNACHDTVCTTLSRNSSKRSASTSTSTLELNTFSKGKSNFSSGTQTTRLMVKSNDDDDDSGCDDFGSFRKKLGHPRFRGGTGFGDSVGDFTDMGASLC